SSFFFSSSAGASAAPPAAAAAPAPPAAGAAPAAPTFAIKALKSALASALAKMDAQIGSTSTLAALARVESLSACVQETCETSRDQSAELVGRCQRTVISRDSSWRIRAAYTTACSVVDILWDRHTWQA